MHNQVTSLNKGRSTDMKTQCCFSAFYGACGGNSASPDPNFFALPSYRKPLVLPPKKGSS